MPLPEVYMKPQGITYKVSIGVGYFRLKDHLTPNNRSQIIHLIEEIRMKGNLNEYEREIVQILQSYIASLSNLKGDDKKTPRKKKYKDEDKKDGLKKKKCKVVEGDNKKDTTHGKEKVVKSRKGGNVKQQTRYGNCDVSTISQGSKPRVEVTSGNLNKLITIVSETALQPLTPTLKSTREYSIRTCTKSQQRELQDITKYIIYTLF